MPAFPPFIQYGADNPWLSLPECQWVIAHAEKFELGRGMIGNGTDGEFREDLDYRCVSMRTLHPCSELEWLYERIRDRVAWTNQDHYRFDLHGLLEGVQYLRYSAEDAVPGHYKWHQDYGGGSSSHRKLSVMIQLSDPADYDDCRLRLFTECEFDVPTIGQGTGIIFPSWQPHCVTPITRGVRSALVCWVGGPQLR